MRSDVLGLDPIGSGSGSGGCFLSSKNYGHRGWLSIVSQKIGPCVELSSTCRAQPKQSDLSERSNRRIGPETKLLSWARVRNACVSSDFRRSEIPCRAPLVSPSAL